MAEQLRAAGAPPELIAEAEAREAAARDEGIEVLACNWDVVQLYDCCQLGYVAGGFGAICTGFSAQEIHAALHWSGLPGERWRETGEGLRLMGAAAAAAINARRKA